jgi:hypothetical protein
VVLLWFYGGRYWGVTGPSLAIVILYAEVVSAVFDGSFADCTEMGVASSQSMNDVNSACFVDSWETHCHTTSAHI